MGNWQSHYPYLSGLEEVAKFSSGMVMDDCPVCAKTNLPTKTSYQDGYQTLLMSKNAGFVVEADSYQTPASLCLSVLPPFLCIAKVPRLKLHGW